MWPTSYFSLQCIFWTADVLFVSVTFLTTTYEERSSFLSAFIYVFVFLRSFVPLWKTSTIRFSVSVPYNHGARSSFHVLLIMINAQQTGARWVATRRTYERRSVVVVVVVVVGLYQCCIGVLFSHDDTEELRAESYRESFRGIKLSSCRWGWSGKHEF